MFKNVLKRGKNFHQIPRSGDNVVTVWVTDERVKLVITFFPAYSITSLLPVYCKFTMLIAHVF